MDINGGVNPTDQPIAGGGQYASQPLDTQQAPMSGVAPAYQPDLNQGAVYGQAQAPQTPQQQYIQPPTNQAPQQSTQEPIQDVKPTWQQELEYSNPVDPPWTRQQTESTAVPGGITSYTGDSLNQVSQMTAPVSNEAYDLLTQPFSDISQSANTSGGGKKPIVIVLFVLIALTLLTGAAFAGYSFGISKADGTLKNTEKSALPESENTNKDNIANKEDLTEQPTLEFDLTKPQYKDEIIQGGLGDQVMASDGLVVLAYNLTMNYRSDSGDGGSGEIVKLDILVGNADSSGSKKVKYTDFILESTLGESIKPLDPVKYSQDSVPSIDLSSGMKAQMSLFYMIKPQVSYNLVRRQSYKVGGNLLLTQIIITAIQDNLDSSVSSENINRPSQDTQR